MWNDRINVRCINKRAFPLDEKRKLLLLHGENCTLFVKAYAMTKKILGLAEFLALLPAQQFDLLHSDGVYIGKRKADGQTIILFQLHGFYVEVHYRRYRRDVEQMVTSDEVGILQPYLEQIHVRDLKKYKKDE